MPSFDIIITVWNRLEYTKRTIASLISSGALRDCQRFIIVDNRSMEAGVTDFLPYIYNMPEFGGKVFLLRRGNNDGWAKAVNDALGLSRAEYLFVSNNDVEYKPGFHSRMFEVFHNQSGIGILGVWRHTAHSFAGVQNDWFREMTDVPAVGWMMPKLAMQKVGMLEEKGPCMTKGGNGEDTDYVQRMKAAGFLVGVTAEDVASHIDGY